MLNLLTLNNLHLIKKVEICEVGIWDCEEPTRTRDERSEAEEDLIRTLLGRVGKLEEWFRSTQS